MTVKQMHEKIGEISLICLRVLGNLEMELKLSKLREKYGVKDGYDQTPQEEWDAVQKPYYEEALKKIQNVMGSNP